MARRTARKLFNSGLPLQGKGIGESFIGELSVFADEVEGHTGKKACSASTKD